MKSRFLPISFFSLVFGLAAFLCTSFSFAGNPGGDKTTVDHLQQMRVNQNTGSVNASDILRAQEAVNLAAGEKSTSDFTLNWQQSGPNNAAGRTRTLLFTNRDPNGQTILTGGVTGGIWKSRNLGLTWHQMNTQDNQVLRVTSIAQTPSGTTYVATGESNCSGGILNMGSGIYRSDNDSVFTLIAGTQPVANDPNSPWAIISKLAVSPSGRIFAATNNGLKYSDNGTDWADAKTGVADNVTVGPDGSVLLSMNGHAYIAVGGDITNFTDMSTNTSTTLPDQHVGGIEFAVAPSDANIIYASLINSNTNGLLNVYKSEDKGNSWFVIFPGNNTYDPLLGAGCYANSLSVFPEDANQVMLGGRDLWRGKKTQATGSYSWEQVSFNYNNEEIFSLLTFAIPPSVHQIAFRPNNVNQFAVATDDGMSLGTITSVEITYKHMIKNCIISQFNSVAFSLNPESSFGGAVTIGSVVIPGGTALNEPENGTQVYTGPGGEVAWSMISPTAIFYSTGNSATPVIRSEDMGVTPSPTFLRSISNANYTPLVLWEDFNFTQSVDSVTFVNKSSRIAPDSTFVVPSANGKFPIYYTTPVAIDSLGTARVKDIAAARFFMAGALSGKSGIYMTKQALQFSVNPTWFKIGNINATDVVTCISVSKDLSVLWAGTKQGTLYRLTNITFANDSATAQADSSTCVIGHASFDSTVYSAFKNRYITSIAIGQDNQTLLVTLGNYGNSEYVYKSVNGLDATPTFTSVQGNLPAMPVYSGLLELSNQNIALIGTDYGVFSTSDIASGSPTWTAQTANTGNVTVTAIKQQTNIGVNYYHPMNYGDLYLATYGRGIFFDDTFGIILGVDPIQPRAAADNALRVQPNPFTNSVSVAYKLTKPSNVNVLVYDLTGRMVYSTSFGNQQTGEYTRTIDLASVPSGTYIIKLDYGYGQAFGKALKVR
jgi:hypothetical protein